MMKTLAGEPPAPVTKWRVTGTITTKVLDVVRVIDAVVESEDAAHTLIMSLENGPGLHFLRMDSFEVCDE